MVTQGGQGGQGGLFANFSHMRARVGKLLGKPSLPSVEPFWAAILAKTLPRPSLDPPYLRHQLGAHSCVPLELTSGLENVATCPRRGRRPRRGTAI